MMQNKEKQNNHASYKGRSLRLNHESLREKEIFWNLIRMELQAYDIAPKKETSKMYRYKQLKIEIGRYNE